MFNFADRMDREELLRLALQCVVSRPQHFTVEAVFTLPVKSGGVFLDGVRARVVVSHPGVTRVYLAETGELLAESLPGQPLIPAASGGARRRGRNGK